MTIEDVLNENGCSFSAAGPIEKRMAQAILDLRADIVEYKGLHKDALCLQDFRNQDQKLAEARATNARLTAALEKIKNFLFNPDGTMMSDSDANTAQVRIAREALSSGASQDLACIREAIKAFDGIQNYAFCKGTGDHHPGLTRREVEMGERALAALRERFGEPV